MIVTRRWLEWVARGIERSQPHKTRFGSCQRSSYLTNEAGDYWFVVMQLNAVRKLQLSSSHDGLVAVRRLLLQPVSCQTSCHRRIGPKLATNI